MRTRPIMTGAYLRPTLYNGPLPRLVPQPAHITGMITWRRKARERRQAKFDGLVESTRLLGSEAQFERELSQLVSQDGAAFDRVFADYAHAWRECLVHVLANGSFADRLEICRRTDQGSHEQHVCIFRQGEGTPGAALPS